MNLISLQDLGFVLLLLKQKGHSALHPPGITMLKFGSWLYVSIIILIINFNPILLPRIR